MVLKMVKKALIVGINDYAPIGAGGPDLRGCVNDAVDMATTLRDLGIVPANPAVMHIVTDGRATRATILSELGWLVKGAKKGDLLVFYYSGHGSQLPDLTGEELDKKDETICPHDFATAGMIKDDDLRAIFAGIAAGVNLEVLLDSCHSGTGTRDLAALCGEGIPEEERVTIRYVEPPIDFGFFLDDPMLSSRRLLKSSPEIMSAGLARDAVIAPLNHVLWAGCKDNQTSGEATVGGVVRGFFTYCFCKCLRSKNGNVTRLELDKMVTSCLKGVGASQKAQLEGTKATMLEKVFT
ncbi:MAG: caspase family protein [Methanothrix sp.]|nr:caspase family protein [Methanothrix sp.]